MLLVNKLAESLCVVLPTQKTPFYRFFSVISRGSDGTDEKNWPYSSSVTQYQHEMIFCVPFYAQFRFNGIFAILVGHFIMKELTEKLFCNPIFFNMIFS